MPDILLATAPDGTLIHVVAAPPGALPEVSPSALLSAWDAAREAAAAGRWGVARRFVFDAASGPVGIAITDRDACCWADAVDRSADLGTAFGLSLCLRLLALVEVMGRSAWLAGLFTVTAEGVALHPALLRAAASLPLDSGARFDAEALRGLLSRALPARASA